MTRPGLDRRRRLPAIVLVALLVTACSGGGAGSTAATAGPASVPPSGEAPPASADPTASPGPGGSGEGSASGMPFATEGSGAPAEPAAGAAAAAEALAGRAWATAPLTDVTTGETFTIQDLAGRPVFIESMAIWCTNCRAQQARFTEALAQLPAGAAEYVVLTVDPSETAEDLARYEARQGFSGRYVVAGKALSAALEDEFGANVLNPPSVPVVFVGPTGEVEFSTGNESVEDILARARG